MAFTSVPAGDVDAKSPVDDTLMGLIKTDLDDLDSRVTVSGAKPFQLELQGKLSYMTNHKRSICYGILNEAAQPSRCRFMLKKSGTSGTLAFDIRRHTAPQTPITGIDYQYSAATSSIAQQGTAINTQSIARATTQIATQSITFAKTAKNIQSIILLGNDADGNATNLVQYNLNATIDSDTLIGDSVVIAGATTGANNGTFVIVQKNRSGGNNIVVTNASGVAQTGVAGTVQETIMSYNYSNPIDANFSAGRSHLFSTHTTGANNGTLLVYAINQSGNNIWVKNAGGVVQAGAVGTADTNHWTFVYSSAVSTTDYVVGEAAKTASHSSGGNNAGALEIMAVNSGGNNLILYNTAGVVQGGVAGNANTNRWKYLVPTDPTSQITAGDTVNLTGHTTGANNGVFVAKELTSGTIVVYNTAGVAQGGAVGLSSTTRKLVKFSSDQSANYTTSSYIEMQGCVDQLYNYRWDYSPFRVLQVNRGGGANYNVVIDSPTGVNQSSPAGYVQVEMKSIFNTAPSLAASATSLEGNQNVVGTSTDFVTGVIPTQTPLMLYMTSMQAGDPQDLTFTLL